ncbi:HEXXH motif domain-containing protein [Streptomyces sp. NPDC059766]|uniref:HEXXH motif domain-containing protein n=1 Tax=Streptomyces sp. NPDC059766 TaxID=3346940 RepID=UPI00365666A3
MSAELSLPHHRLPAAGVLELMRGEGGPDTLALLLGAERSRRLLLLRLLSDTTDIGPAWDLLSRAQRRAPQVVEDILMYPQTGMWLASALRQLRATASVDEPPLPAVVGRAGALAAAAGLRAGLDFAIDVPVRHGWVPLPTLGSAVLPVSSPWATATLRAQGASAVFEVPGATVAVPSPFDAPGPHWHPVRRLSVGPEGRRLTVVLEDTDPYRTYPMPVEPHPLSEEAAALWQRLLEQAWAVLLDEQPVTADAMRRSWLSLTPTAARERFRPRSVTSGEAFGGIEASEPDDGTQLAATLIHEFQHTKLSGLLHLAPLLHGETDASPELWYAPWRDDPRPLGGLLQGIYAFVGVTAFWRGHRATAPEHDTLAHFEFALWRIHVSSAMEQIHHHPRLTPLGRALLDTLRGQAAQWLSEPVPDKCLALARLCATDRVARWRAHHRRPSVSAVDATVRAWLAGAATPPPSLGEECEIVPDPSARWLDSLAVLVRYRLADMDDERTSLGTAEKAAAMVAGALTADALLAAGDATAARHAYVSQLATESCPAGAWAGLGQALAMAGTDPAAARLLCHHPERARAVHQALLRFTGTAPDPVRLAAWLGSAEG